MTYKYVLNLMWSMDIESVHNDFDITNMDTYNRENIYRALYKDYRVFVYPIREGKYIIGYAYNIDNRKYNQMYFYDSFLDDNKIFKSINEARSIAETDIKELDDKWSK